MVLQKAQEGFTKQTTRYTDGTTGTTALNILGYAIPDVQGPLISLHPLYNKAFANFWPWGFLGWILASEILIEGSGAP